jgi:hypothetical protein
MEVVAEPTRDMFKFYVPDVRGFFESHAEKPAATMLCKSKLRRTKPMYRYDRLFCSEFNFFVKS